MRKILVLAIVSLLLALSAAPVLAQVEQHDVTIQGSGRVVFGGNDAIFTVLVDTATGIVSMRAMFPGTITPDGQGYEQFLAGLYWEGEITGCTFDGDMVAVDCLVTAYLLPWHEPFPGIGPYEVPVEGELTGPGKRGQITIGGSLSIPGTIIIR